MNAPMTQWASRIRRQKVCCMVVGGSVRSGKGTGNAAVLPEVFVRTAGGGGVGTVRQGAPYGGFSLSGAAAR